MHYSFWQPSYSGELYHYGVKGMRWGAHKARKYYDEARTWGEIARQKMWEANAHDKNKQALINDKPIIKVRDSVVKNNKMTMQELDVAKYVANKNAVRERNKLVTKSTKKLEKLNSKYEKRQARADKQYAKAERKANSLFSSKRAADRAFRKAAKSQFKANKVAARGKRWYEEMEKAYSHAEIKMSKRNREIGTEFVRQVRANSRAMYAASYAGG